MNACMGSITLISLLVVISTSVLTATKCRESVPQDCYGTQTKVCATGRAVWIAKANGHRASENKQVKWSIVASLLNLNDVNCGEYLTTEMLTKITDFLHVDFKIRTRSLLIQTTEIQKRVYRFRDENISILDRF